MARLRESLFTVRRRSRAAESRRIISLGHTSVGGSMMRHRLAWVLALGLVAAWVTQATALTEVRYFDATISNTQGFVSGLDDWFSGDDGSTGGTPASGTSTADNLWRFRTNQGSGAGMWEATSSSTQPEDAVQIQTTLSGAPNGTYNVYVFYLTDPSPANWQIKAGLTPNPTQIYDRSGADGIAGQPVFSGSNPTLNFSPGFVPEQDSNQDMLYAIIGQATVTDGNLSVYIDDLPTNSLPGDYLARRTWYDGIGYEIETSGEEIESVQTGAAEVGATWSNNSPATAGNNYNVNANHVVTANQDFAGEQIVVRDQGTLDIALSGLDFKKIVIEDGGNLSESDGSSLFILGHLFDVNTPLGVLELQGDVSLNVGAGEELQIGLSVAGSGNMDLNTGAGSVVRLADSAQHDGAIRFNGQGDEFTLEWDEDFGTVEMNSTGANRFRFMQQGQVDEGNLVFNEPGSVEHDTPVVTPLSRLVAIGTLTANAAVTVDISEPYNAGSAHNERRLGFQSGLAGDGDITVEGMSFDPTDVGASVGLHEFEVGTQATEPANIQSDAYSGTITVGGYVNAEFRRSQPNANVVLNANSRFETGHDVTGTSKSIAFGEMEVNSAATLEVGHEEPIGNSTGHQVGHVLLTTSGGHSGDLTLNDGSKVALQVNGLGANEFDTIVAEGDISFVGNVTLELWWKPISTNSTQNPNQDPLTDTYTPQVNDSWVIMTLAGQNPPTDFDESGTVDGGDLIDWEGAFGAGDGADADGDGDSDGADFLSWQRTLGDMGQLGSIIGNFFDVVAPPVGHGGAWPVGLDFTTEVVGNEVILKIISAPAPIQSVPEPSTVALLGTAALGLLAARRRRAKA
jgi:hypothetical protein